MPLERNDVEHPLWRKKVDGSLLRHSMTPIPNWVCKMWGIETLFPEKGGRRAPDSQVSVRFEGAIYEGAVAWYRRSPTAAGYRLWFADRLRFSLMTTFSMSHMRDLEGRLRAAKGEEGDAEEDIPFWEFLDIEFDATNRTFLLTAHYVQKPSFPSLFRRLAESPPLKRVRDELAGKSLARIHKQGWKPRSEFETEIGATNVIYMLADTAKKLIYVGECADLIARFRRGHGVISSWDYYRYDLLPTELGPFRLQIERMLICDMDALFGPGSDGLASTMSQCRLVNLKIDR